jgi:hypothetical protein
LEPGNALSQRNHRPGQTVAGAVEKEPHAQSFAALHRYQPHMAADVVAIHQQSYLLLVEGGILFQALDSLFDGAAKPGADLKTFADSAVRHHGRLLDAISRIKSLALEKYFLKGLKYFQPVPMLMKKDELRQITV